MQEKWWLDEQDGVKGRKVEIFEGEVDLEDFRLVTTPVAGGEVEVAITFGEKIIQRETGDQALKAFCKTVNEFKRNAEMPLPQLHKGLKWLFPVDVE
jgi:hypothetical protein